MDNPEKYMSRELVEKLGKAGYEARRKQLALGIYPKVAYLAPGHETFYEWDDMPVSADDELAIKTLYRKQGEAAVMTFILDIMVNGTPAAKDALKTLLHEMGESLWTDKE